MQFSLVLYVCLCLQVVACKTKPDEQSVRRQSNSWVLWTPYTKLSLLASGSSPQIEKTGKTWTYHVSHPQPLRDTIIIEPAVAAMKLQHLSSGTLRCQYNISRQYLPREATEEGRSDGFNDPFELRIVSEDYCYFDSNTADEYTGSFANLQQLPERFKSRTDCYNPYAMADIIRIMHAERKKTRILNLNPTTEAPWTSMSLAEDVVIPDMVEKPSELTLHLWSILQAMSIVVFCACFAYMIVYLWLQLNAMILSLVNRQQVPVPPNPQHKISSTAKHAINIVCRACRRQPLEHIFHPCHHLALCWPCYQKWIEKGARAGRRHPVCPVCRMPITECVRVYVA